MSTTFSELIQLSATLNSSSELRLSNALRATLDSSAVIGADGVQTMGFISGGVTYNALHAEMSGSGEIVANLGVIRSLQATLDSSSEVRQGYGSVAELGAMRSLGGNTPYAGGVAVLGALESEAFDADPVPAYSSSINVMGALTSSSYVLVGAIAESTSVLGAIVGLSGDTPYAGSVSVLPPLTSLGNNAQSVIGPSVRAYTFMGTDMEASTEFLLEITDGFELEDSISFARELAAAMAEQLSTAGALAAFGDYTGTMSEVMEFIYRIEQSRVPIVWVHNTDSGANWTYRDWDFNSFGAWQGRYFAAGAEGLFELTGDTDNGAPIISSVLTGKSDLGTVQLKRMAYVYVGATADGGMTLIVHTDDGQINEYAISARELLQNSRTGIGKKLRSKYWQLEFTNPDGGDFELESVELMPDATIRRI